MSGLCTRCGDNVPATNDEWCGECILEVETAMAELEAEEKDVMPTPLLTHSRYYTMEDLERCVAEYEDEYGLPSDALLELHRSERTPIEIPSHDRHVWLSFYRELLEKRT